jgi:hypothetical protein
MMWVKDNHWLAASVGGIPEPLNSLLRNSILSASGTRAPLKGKTLSLRWKRCATQRRVFQQTVKPG